MMRQLHVAWLATAAVIASARASAAEGVPSCHGAYAEDLSALSQAARDLESKTGSYSYAVRTTATYECVSYDRSGTLKRRRFDTTAYGTAFAFRRDGDSTLLVTNDHVAEWPDVTDDQHPVDGIASGCKRVADALTIVDDDRDDYAADDIPLERVVADVALDVAVLRAPAALAVMPWKIGDSAALAARDAVEVKGFPLGEFRATNVGKVVVASEHDGQGDWDHDDFVVDALLTSGGSGSPVLAVSCKTGAFELVGIFHARYLQASALNTVIAIDQVENLITTLKATPRPASDPGGLDASARDGLARSVRQDADPGFFAFGPLAASVSPREDGALVFRLFSEDFPADDRPLLTIEDLPATDRATFGVLGAVQVRGAHGLEPYVATAGDPDGAAVIAHTLATLRTDALAAYAYREASRSASASREVSQRARRLKRALDRLRDRQTDDAHDVEDLVARAAAPSK